MRFVDVSLSYWDDEENARTYPRCVILDTVTDSALANSAGQHVLTGTLDVLEAGGREALNVVPEGFFRS